MRTIRIILSLAFSLMVMMLRAQSPQAISVELTASIKTDPLSIELNWVGQDASTSYNIYRKLKSATSWGGVKANLPGTATQYVDNTISKGVSYEYQVVRIAANFVGYGYINAGSEIPAQESKGIILVVIEQTIADSLNEEINTLLDDLQGDGWKASPIYVLKNAKVTDVKALIMAEYLKNPGETKALYLLGHIPVAYSGDINPDGHPDHRGAWPADVYYGDMNGTWTDNFVNDVVAGDPRHRNIPGDGKFDQSIAPSPTELQVGRVDFFNMPSFVLSEVQLLRNYLHKAHDYKHKKFEAVHRAVIDDNFGYFNGEAFAHSGWRNFSSLVGSENVTADDYFTAMKDSSYLWSYGCGGGTYTSAGGVGSTSDFAQSQLKGVFTVLFGSYFGDWDSQNNFLRAPLAQGTTLTNVWAGRPHWQFHQMALGENIGFCVQNTQNNNIYSSNYGNGFIHVALMGDPSLRNDVVYAVPEIAVQKEGNHARISWIASSEPGVTYNIYAKNDSIQQFIRLNENAIDGTVYIDSCLLYNGNYTYMVRAVKLHTGHSGSYFNLSQGIKVNIVNQNSFMVTANAEHSRIGSTISFLNKSLNSTNYLWVFDDGTTSNEENPDHVFSDGSHTVTLIASNECDEDSYTFEVKVATSLNENLEDGVSVYPNPSNGKFKIAFIGKNTTDISIQNMYGQTIWHNDSRGTNLDVDLGDIAKGVYLIKGLDGKSTWTRKIIIQ